MYEILIGNQIERAEIRVFWLELKWGGNGGERKRNFRSKKSFFFSFFFFGKVEWSQESMRGFYFNGILVI